MPNNMTIKHLWIVGAGGFGREVATYANDVVLAGSAPWRFAGFADDRVDALKTIDPSIHVRSPIADLVPKSDEVICVAIGDPQVRIRVAKTLAERGFTFASVIHPTAVIGQRVELGAGCIAAPFVTVTCDVTIGAYSVLGAKSGVGHDSRLGEGVTMSAYTEVAGSCTLGDRVFLGSHALVAPGTTMGADSYAFAGAVVLRDTGERERVGGNPARVVSRG